MGNSFAVSELARLLCASLSKQYVSAQLCMPGHAPGAVEGQFVSVLRVLFALDATCAEPLLIGLMGLEYDLPGSVLHAAALFRQQKSLQAGFALIFRFMQKDNALRSLYANQFVFAGALFSDYRNELFAVDSGQSKLEVSKLEVSLNHVQYRNAACAEYIAILTLVCGADPFYAREYFRSVVDAA